MAEQVLSGADVFIDGGVIRAVGGTPASVSRRAEILDVRGGLVAPGLIDLHIHGGFGKDFSSATEEEIGEIRRGLLSQGVTGFVPTLLSLSHVATLAAIGRIVRAAEAGEGARILGIHLEGPYLNPLRCGAHPVRSLRAPSLRELRESEKAAGGWLRIVTLAPERKGAEALIRYGRRRGMLLSAGHSDAGAPEMEAAVRAGVRHVTHLFNAMRPFHHREEGIVNRALVDDRLSCELIYDRQHVSRSAADIALRCKPFDKLILVTDGAFGLGLSRGSLPVGRNRCVVRNGAVRVARTGVLAGSACPMLRAMRFLKGDFQLPPERLFRMASLLPARLLGERRGEIAVGRPADLVVLDRRWNLRMVFLGGRRWR